MLFRSGDVSYETYAETDAAGYKTIQLSPAQLPLLKTGVNILAVEMHQCQSDITDMIFDLRAFTPAFSIEYGSEWDYYDAGQQPEVQKYSTKVKSGKTEIPEKFILYQNYPNPFNPKTTIRYQIPKQCKVVLSIYNVLGREAAKLVNEKKEAGNYAVNFNASKLTSGLYFYQLKAGEFISTKKMIMIR